MEQQNDLAIMIVFIIEAIFWLAAYGLIIRRSFLDKTYGMPIVAMCGNLAWEIMYGANIFSACPIIWPDCYFFMESATFSAVIFDLIILYAILKYGRDEFSQPWMKKYFPSIVGLGLGTALLLMYFVPSEFYVPNIMNAIVDGEVPAFIPLKLLGGVYMGFAQAFLMGILFVLMGLSRDTMRGQSIYIALFMFLGNIPAYILNLLFVLGDLEMTVHILAFGTFIFNAAYVWLLYQKSRSLGIDPWRRF